MMDDFCVGFILGFDDFGVVNKGFDFVVYLNKLIGFFDLNAIGLILFVNFDMVF